MASLWSLVNDKQHIHLCAYKPITHDHAHKSAAFIANFPPKLINIGEFILTRKGGEECVIHDMTPCHRSLWMEWLDPETRHRYAVHVARLAVAEGETVWKLPPAHADAKHMVVFTMISEHDAQAFIVGIYMNYIDGWGTPFWDNSQLIYAGTGEEEAARRLAYTIGEVLSIMNTHGTRMEPPLDARPPVNMKRPDRAPFSVWHTIHIPRHFASQPLPPGADVTPEMIERREHWVRAHRADYRHGKGLFGRVKAVIWVPEHQRGNPELGTVQQAFKVKKPE